MGLGGDCERDVMMSAADGPLDMRTALLLSAIVVELEHPTVSQSEVNRKRRSLASIQVRLQLVAKIIQHCLEDPSCWDEIWTQSLGGRETKPA